VAGDLGGAAGAWASGRAALTTALVGDLDAAVQDLAAAHRDLPDPAPRGLIVLLTGAAATIEAVRGELRRGARRLAGLATATVPPDALAPDRWEHLAAMVVGAGGDAATALAMLGAPDGAASSTRHGLLTAWLSMRTGLLTPARDALTAVAGPVLRRDALLAAAVTAGLARRSGDERAVTTTWHRVAPVIADADVEVLLLDAWGELATTAAAVSPAESGAIADAMRAAVARAGSPWWAVAAEAWWRLERALVSGGPGRRTDGRPADPDPVDVAVDVARTLGALAATHPQQLGTRAEAATTWVGVLAGTAEPPAVARATTRLAAAGHRHEAAVLCGTAAALAADPAAARSLLVLVRGLRGQPGGRRRSAGDELSDREREVGRLVLDGLTHKEIGARLYISPKTVEQHVARLRQKLVASNRAELVAALRRTLEA
jgi:DNA-binding CsgD family transcriptional regulator